MKDIFKLCFYLLMSALNFNLILKPLQIVVGGTQGLALLLSKISNCSPAFLMLIINLAMFILCAILLDKKVTISIIFSTFIYPLLIKITSFLTAVAINESLFAIVFSGVISGITLGNIVKLGYSPGGLNVMILLLKKYFNVQEYFSVLFINGIIILCGIKVFGLYKAIIGIIIIIINSIIVKQILKNVKNCKIN